MYMSPLVFLILFYDIRTCMCFNLQRIKRLVWALFVLLLSTLVLSANRVDLGFCVSLSNFSSSRFPSFFPPPPQCQTMVYLALSSVVCEEPFTCFIVRLFSVGTTKTLLILTADHITLIAIFIKNKITTLVSCTHPGPTIAVEVLSYNTPWNQRKYMLELVIVVPSTERLLNNVQCVGVMCIIVYFRNEVLGNIKHTNGKHLEYLS